MSIKRHSTEAIVNKLHQMDVELAKGQSVAAICKLIGIHEHPNHVWAYDFVSARTDDGLPLRLLVIVDEFTRECLSIDVARQLKSDDVLERLACRVVQPLFSKAEPVNRDSSRETKKCFDRFPGVFAC